MSRISRFGFVFFLASAFSSLLTSFFFCLFVALAHPRRRSTTPSGPSSPARPQASASLLRSALPSRFVVSLCCGKCVRVCGRGAAHFCSSLLQGINIVMVARDDKFFDESYPAIQKESVSSTQCPCTCTHSLPLFLSRSLGSPMSSSSRSPLTSPMAPWAS